MNKVITVKIPEKLDAILIKRVVHEGYGLRGKSKWISKAIENLMTYDGYVELVNTASESEENNKTISFRISPELLKKMEQAIVAVRREFPTLEGVQSNIVRASIYQALLR